MQNLDLSGSSSFATNFLTAGHAWRWSEPTLKMLSFFCAFRYFPDLVPSSPSHCGGIPCSLRSARVVARKQTCRRPLAPQREIDPEVPQVSAATVRRSARVHLAGCDPHQHGQREDGQEETPEERQRRGTCYLLVVPVYWCAIVEEVLLVAHLANHCINHCVSVSYTHLTLPTIYSV